MADARDLREAIASALKTRPIVKPALRAAVWSYVGNERRAEASPAKIIADLTAIVDASELTSVGAREEVTRQVILWCVEEYFGKLGGDPLTAASHAKSEGA